MNLSWMRALGGVAVVVVVVVVVAMPACAPPPLTPERFQHDAPAPAAAPCEIVETHVDGMGALVNSYLYDASGRLLFAHTHPWYRGDAWEQFHYENRTKTDQLTATTKHTEHAEMAAPCITCSFLIRTVSRTEVDYDKVGRVISVDTVEHKYNERSRGQFEGVSSISGSHETTYSGADLVRWGKWRYVRRNANLVDIFGSAGFAGRFQIQDQRIVAAESYFCGDTACHPWISAAMSYDADKRLAEMKLTFVDISGGKRVTTKEEHYAYDAGGRLVRIEERDTERSGELEVTKYEYDEHGRLTSRQQREGALQSNYTYKAACPLNLSAPHTPHAGEGLGTFLLLPTRHIVVPGTIAAWSPLGWATPFGP